MIDSKHANIGATVSLLLNAHKLTTGTDLPNDLASLFTMESEDCDYRTTGEMANFCNYHDTCVQCIVGNCPLGAIVEKTSREGGWPDPTEFMMSKSRKEQDRMGIDTTMTFGCDPDECDGPTQGGSIHLGHVGWRKWWNNFKKLFKVNPKPECSCSFETDWDCPVHGGGRHV